MGDRIINDNQTFRRQLGGAAVESGFADAACIRLDSGAFLESADALRAAAAPELLSSMPGYVRHAAAVKESPASFIPWAKSAVMALAPFSVLPESAALSLLRRSDAGSPLSGLIAGYAIRMDYHRFAKSAMDKLGGKLEGLAGRSFRHKSFSDSNPLPERALASIAGLGGRGRNHCLVHPGLGSAFFIASLWTDFPFPEALGSLPEGFPRCADCGLCAASCPNSLLEDRLFDCSNCAAAIASETKGALSKIQADSLAGWIFGCGLCASSCPRSNMPEPFAVDLEWLLMSRSSAVADAISGTVMERSGVSILRRNALAVLSSRKSPDAIRLIRRFRDCTASDFLKTFASSLVE